MRKGFLVAVALTLVVTSSACQPASKTAAGSSPQGTGSSSATSTVAGASAAVTSEPAVLSLAPQTGSTQVRPDRPVTVDVVHGRISRVRLTTEDGKQLKGELDGGSWRLTDALAPGTTYTLSALGASEDGSPVTATSTFTTLQANRLVSTTLIPGDDWTVGVGMPVIVVFSQPVKNKKAAESALTVSSTPSVEGAWRWFSATEVHWRPKEYWPSGTKVNVTAAMSKVELSDGVWGRRTTTSSFTVGRSQILTVDTARHSLTVRQGDKVVRSMPVTTGKAGFRTRNGIKVIMSRESQVRMDAATLGKDKSDPEYYNLLVNWALRLTYSGEFLHAAPWSVGSQGRANVSHGCTGMNTANARWLYDNSLVGDVVVYTGSSRALEWGNGYTEWNMPFDTYAAGTDV
ncbi:MAG: L,D-transpeptidase family protein [Kineosporiaceae bacterium]|nr:L,D-transpeptidase family protein [Kineosporiaceae bacterium]